ncbi:MAG: hypothetical protein NTX64_05780 [Elusimicrobia bacterium]|nr:hypothetical protein [Elusimicrobiota bacterium]
MVLFFIGSLFLAQTSWASPAGRPGAIYNFGANARALGLGGAYTALSQDDSAVYYNPAGLGFVTDRRISFMEATLYEGVNYNYIGYAQPAFGGGLGLNLLRSGAGDVDGRDAFNRQTGSFGYSETGVSLGYGYWGLLDGTASAGLSAKMLQRSVANVSNRLIGVDAAAGYMPPVFGHRLRLAAMVQNIAQTKSGNTNDTLPLAFKLGASWEFAPAFHLSGDVSSEGQLAIGTEYGWKFAAFRVGLQPQGLSFGTGVFLWNSLHLDFAVYNDSMLGMSNRVSLGWALPRAVRVDRPKERSQDRWREGLQALQDRRFVAASHDFDRALKIDPDLATGPEPRTARLVREFVHGISLQDDLQRQEALVADNSANQLVGKSVAAYLSGDDYRALLFAQAALGTDPRSDAHRAVFGFMQGRAGRRVPEEEILPLRDLAEHKDKKALKAFYLGQFDVARAEWEDAVLLLPDDPMLWTRLGSASIATGAVEIAKKAYRRALELDPKNKDVVDFMTVRGWR